MFGLGKARKRREAERSADAYISEAYFWQGSDRFKGRFDDALFSAQSTVEREAVRETIIRHFLRKAK
jgi:hypothetical protein